MKKVLITLLVTGMFILIPAQVYASMENDEVKWTENGEFVVLSDSNGPTPKVVGDGYGGGLFFYKMSDQGSASGIYAKRIDSDGVAQWSGQVKAIVAQSGGSGAAHVVSDSQHGAIVVWQDNRDEEYNTDIYTQRINVSGEVQWTNNGVQVSHDQTNEGGVQVISDSNGGAIIVWIKNNVVYANRINTAGTLLWGTEGKAISETTYDFSGLEISKISLALTEDGGSVVFWQDDNVIYGQRITSDGERIWNSDVVVASSVKFWYGNQNVVISGSNIYVLFKEGIGNYGDLRVQKINLDGDMQWENDGVLISDMVSNMHEMIISDGVGGLVVGWVSWNDTITKMYGQRIDQEGNLKWGSDGIGIIDISLSHYAPELLADGRGNVFFTTYASTDTPQMWSDLYMQKVDVNGRLLWGNEGYLVSTGDGNRYRYSVANDGNRGIIVVWEDERNHYTNPGYNHDIFTQRIKPIEVATPVNILATPISAGGPQVIIKNYLGETLTNFFAYDSSLRFGMTATSIDLGTDGISEFIIAPGVGAEPLVRLFNSAGYQIAEFMFYTSNMRAGINMAAGDIDDDGRVEIVAVPKQGAAPHIRILDSYGNLESQFYAYAETFRGGVSIALADVDNDGMFEIITMPESSAGPQVRVFEKDGTLVSQFWAYAPTIRGGYNLSVGDVNADDVSDIIITPKSGLGPQVAMFKGDGTLIGRFFAYAETFRGGLNISIGDVNADGVNEIIATPESNAGPHVRVFNTRGEVLSQFFAYSNHLRGNFSSFIADVDADGVNEIVTAPGAGMGPQVRIFDMWGTVKSQFFTHHTGFRGGVNIFPAY
ncbi:MAG: FG-GAP repeat domain-containing protein [Candidatus Kerfeldbacteria bacterium]